MTFIATTSASDGIDGWVWMSATVCLMTSAIMALVALVRLVRAKSGVRRIALAGVCLGLFPFFVAAYGYVIDCAAVRGDGTPASGPLWNAVLIPGIPLLASGLMIGWRCLIPARRH